MGNNDEEKTPKKPKFKSQESLVYANYIISPYKRIMDMATHSVIFIESEEA